VCGRRHHHMPIKILAVPFVHFLYWWNKKVRNRAEDELNTRLEGQPE
jgi:heme/copper-type cytochrome/quinol oxidase subunit 2